MTSAVVIFSERRRLSHKSPEDPNATQKLLGAWKKIQQQNWLTNGWRKTEEASSKQKSENPICRKNSSMEAWGNMRGIEQKQELPEPELTKTKWILKAQQQNRAQNNHHLCPLQHITCSFHANLNTTKVIFIFSLWWREVQGRLSDQTTF